MSKKELSSILYTNEEFHSLFCLSKGFNDDHNKNHRIREDNETFSDFIDSGSSSLIEEFPNLVKKLL